jgi:hypothetical protein
MLAAQAARTVRKWMGWYAVLLFAYWLFVLVLQPIARDSSAPAAAVFGAGACFSSSSSSSTALADRSGFFVQAVLWLSRLPVWLLGWFKDQLCKEVQGACQEGIWFEQDCLLLFQQPGRQA